MMANTGSRRAESLVVGRSMRCEYMVTRRRGGSKHKRQCTGRPSKNCTHCSDHRLKHNHGMCFNKTRQSAVPEAERMTFPEPAVNYIS